MRLCPVRTPFRACHTRAMGTAIEAAVCLNAVANHLHATVLAGGGKGVNGALGAVEGVRITREHTYLEGLVILISTNSSAPLARSDYEATP